MHLYIKSRQIADSTVGELYLKRPTRNIKPFAFTMEREWLNNTPSQSCIPNGTYTLEWHDSPRYGRRLHVVSDVLGVGIHEGLRTHILLHPANWAHQLEGCIAIGESFRQHMKGLMVTSSSTKLGKLEEILKDETDIKLTIIRDLSKC